MIKLYIYIARQLLQISKFQQQTLLIFIFQSMKQSESPLIKTKTNKNNLLYTKTLTKSQPLTKKQFESRSSYINYYTYNQFNDSNQSESKQQQQKCSNHLLNKDLQFLIFRLKKAKQQAIEQQSKLVELLQQRETLHAQLTKKSAQLVKSKDRLLIIELKFKQEISFEERSKLNVQKTIIELNIEFCTEDVSFLTHQVHCQDQYIKDISHVVEHLKKFIRQQQRKKFIGFINLIKEDIKQIQKSKEIVDY